MWRTCILSLGILWLGVLLLAPPAWAEDDPEVTALAKGVKDYRTKFKLIALGPRALHPLMAQVASQDATLAFESASALRWIAHHQTRGRVSDAMVAELASYVHAGNDAQKALAAELLGDLGAVDAVSVLWDAVVAGDLAKPPARAALDSLRRIPGKGVSTKLAALAWKQSGARQDALFEVLGARGDVEGLPPLLNHAAKSNVAAVRALGAAGLAEAEPVLTHLCAQKMPAAFTALLAVAGKQADTGMLARLYGHAKDDAQRLEVIRAVSRLPVAEGTIIPVLDRASKTPALRKEAQGALLTCCAGFSKATAALVYAKLLVESADAAVTMRALSGLGRTGGEDAVALMLPFTEAEDAAIRTTALVALAQLPGRRATERLIETLSMSEDSMTQSLLIRVLRERGSIEAVDAISEYLDGYGDALKRQAGEALIALAATGGGERARATYHELLGAGLADVALRGLERVGDLDSVEPIEAVLEGASAPTRDLAGRALAAIAGRLVAAGERSDAVDVYGVALEAGAPVENDLRLLGESVEFTARGGRVHAWWLKGPFVAPNQASWAKAEAPESGVTLRTKLPDQTEKLLWGSAVVAGDQAIVDLDARFTPNDNVCAYAYAEIFVTKARAVVMKTGSDDGIRVWVNGTLVHSKLEPRGLTVDQDSFAAELVDGWNRILVKVCEGGGGWGFHLRMETPKGRPLKFKIR